MGNLLSAGLYRLLRSKVFYVGMASMALIEVWFLMNASGSAIVEGMEQQSFFGFLEMLIFVAATFCGLFLGAEFSNGTLRNKLILGHTKAQVYSSHVFLSALAGLCFCIVSIAAGLLFGLLSKRTFTLDAGELFGYFVCSFLIVLAISSLSAMIATLFTNRSAGIVVNLLLAIALLFSASYIVNALHQPETIPQSSTITQNGITLYSVDPTLPEIPNPAYPRGAWRAILQFLWDFLPTCQGMQLTTVEVDSFWTLGLYSLLFIALTTGVGLALFQHKDIK